MTKIEQLLIVKTSNKDEFIKFAKGFNIFKTISSEDFLEVKNAILQKLEYHKITIDDIKPNPRNAVFGTIAGKGRYNG
jgi:hypothetical protein